MFKKYLISVTFLLISFITCPSFAGFTIMPVELEINKNNKIAVMTLQNNDHLPKKFQLALLKREYKNGVEEYAPTKDLIVTPVMFTLQGNKMQLIRIALNNKETFSKRKNDYRIEVKELPHRIKIDDNITSRINFVIRFNIPITVSS